MRISKLDGLRGIFSMMIVLLHYRKNLIPELIHTNFFIRSSYTFVDFFFVLSGFVIAYNYNSISTSKELGGFIKKRIIRLYPLLLFTTLVYLAFEILANTLYAHILDTPESLNVILLKTLNTLTFLNSTSFFVNNLGMNEPSWSISSEMISYLIFGITTLWLSSRRKDLALLSMIIGAMVFCERKGSYFSNEDYGYLRGIVSFNLGYFVWVLSKKKIKMPDFLEVVLVIILVLLFYVFNRYPKESYQKDMFGMLVFPIYFSLFILIFLNTNGIISKLLKTVFFQFLGKISYSIYLNHLLLITVIPYSLFKIFKIPQKPISEIIVAIASIAFVIIYSAFTYNLIELKGGRLLKRIIKLKEPNKSKL